MKRFLSLLAIAAISFVSCHKEDLTPPEEPVSDILSAPSVIHARTESNSQADTKAHWNNNLKVLWNAGDEISMFNLNTYNIEYRFTGADNASEGDFEKVGEDQGEPVFNTVFAVYPYSSAISVSVDGSGISLTLPSVQTYSEGSFDPSANIMVAAREPMSEEDTNLEFKNACGYLRIKLYGDNVTVSSITLEGRNGEKIAGEATITQAAGGLPSVTMETGGTSGITLTCPSPISVGTTATTAAEFNFVIPPVTFSGGIKITVKGTSGGEEAVFLKSTSNSVEVSRNVRRTMAALKLDGDILSVRFDDDAFEEYCLENFDSDGDGLISTEEASVVTEIAVDNMGIESLKGLEAFTGLTTLSCKGNQLTNLDISANAALRTLNCSSNSLTSLNVENNPALVSIDAGDNPFESLEICGKQSLASMKLNGCTSLKNLNLEDNVLTSVDVDGCTSLEEIQCSGNQLESIRLNGDTALKYLSLINNKLTSIDISDNTSLLSINIGDNFLTSLDVSCNPFMTSVSAWNNKIESFTASDSNTELNELNLEGNLLESLDVTMLPCLRALYVMGNKLASLDLSQNGNLDYLACYQNQLTELDLSHNPMLNGLICYENQLSVLDLSNNPKMYQLDCSDNLLTALDLSEHAELWYVAIINNEITTLDVSKSGGLKYLVAWSSSRYLEKLYKKTSASITYMFADGESYPTIDPADYGTEVINVD